MSERQYIRANLAWTPSPSTLKLHSDYLIVVDEHGMLEFAQPFGSTDSKNRLEENGGKLIINLSRYGFLFPAFVDLHLHAPQFLYAGTGLGLPLMQWLDKHAFEAEKKIDEDIELARQVYEQLCHQLIENGIGTTLLFGTIASKSNCELGLCFQKAGLRGFVGKISMDLHAPSDYIESSASASSKAARRFCLDEFPSAIKTASSSTNQPLVFPTVTPRFIPTCSTELLQNLGKLVEEQKGNLIIQSHMCESADEVAWVQSMHNEQSDVSIFDKAGLIGSSTVMHHCTSLNPQERKLLIEKGSSIASCPISNAYFSDRPFAMRESIDEGLKVGLGSDIAGGYTLDMMQVMRSAVLVSKLRSQSEQLSNSKSNSKDITWIEALYLATRGGSLALSPPLDPLHGSFKIGAPFDAQFIITRQQDGSKIGGINYFTPEWDLQEAVEKWWTLGDTRNRKGLWIAGRRLS